MRYKKALKEIRKEGCPFCREKQEDIIASNEYAYITPARAPYVKDHLLVIPFRHVLRLKDLKPEEEEGIFDLVSLGMKLLRKKYPAVEVEYREGDNLKDAQKSIPHLHFHLLPLAKGERFKRTGRKFLSAKELKDEVKEIKNLMPKQIKESAKKFNSEVKKSVSTAIIAAFGLLTALAWKDVISEFVNKIVGSSPVQGLLINAIIITIISVVAIMLITKFLEK